MDVTQSFERPYWTAVYVSVRHHYHGFGTVLLFILVYFIIIMDLVAVFYIVYRYSCMLKFIDILFQFFYTLFCYGDESYKEDFSQMGQTNGTVLFVLVSKKL